MTDLLIELDVTAVEAEFERMIAGEVPFSVGRLSEIAQRNLPPGVTAEVDCFRCDVCGGELTFVRCHDCAGADCPECGGEGSWFECRACPE